MKLVIANKNYSSWSLRPWLLLRHAGIAFEEVQLGFNAPDFAQQVAALSPAGRVPILIDGALTVWDSLAICEFVAERFADRQLWPTDAEARAQARSVCAEMHAGFSFLRQQWPMNISARLPGRGWSVALQRDVDRICQLWTVARQTHGAGGPFLFGRFSVADAYFAPVVTRFVTYDAKLPAIAQDYRDTMLAVPALQAWSESAAAEHDFVAYDEPYRLPPG